MEANSNVPLRIAEPPHVPASTAPPINHVNISLNDQIFSGDKKFCPSGTNYKQDCPSKQRPRIPVSNGTSPFHPFTDETIRFLRHG